MAISNKLCNPTKTDVEIPYEKGVVIHVPADGSTTLTVQQMDDYRPDKPGAEEARRILDESGVFLEDPELDYDRQALKAIKNAIRAGERRFQEARDRLVEMHVAAGIEANTEAPVFKEKLRKMGLLRLQERIEELKKREELYRQALGGDIDDSNFQPAVPKLDPERTCYAIDPPREFASKTALNIFLSEHPDIAKKHEALSQAEAQAESEDDSDLTF